MNPIGGRLLPGVFPREVVCHCLLIETANRLVLIDSGLGVRDIETPGRLGLTGRLVGLAGGPEQTAIARLKSLGFSSGDVTDIVPTHLDFDHAGGLEDCPRARVHVSAAEYQAWSSAKNFRLRERYKTVRFSHEVNWCVYEASSEWNGFASTQPKELPPEIVCVELPGHTPGHFGVALETSDGWLLHAGDAYYDRRELDKEAIPMGLSLFQKIVHFDYATAMKTQSRLRDLQDVRVFCAHDPIELTSLQSAQ